MCFIIPSVGFYIDHEWEFANIKLDEFTTKMGISVRFGPSYYLWSNGLNEGNHASYYMTIKIFMEDKKVKITNFLIKTTLWTHNTWIFTFAAG